MGVIQYLRAVFRAEVTLGEIFAILIPLTIASIVFVWARDRQKRPFSFKYADQPFDPSAKARLHRTYSQRKHLEIGKSKLTIAVRTRVATTANPFDIRFVERGLFRRKYRNASQDIIQIIEVKVPDWNREAEPERDHTGPNIVTVDSDGEGGFIVSTRLPKRWVIGQLLWIELIVEAKSPWSGFLGFQGQTDRKAVARRGVKVGEITGESV